MRWAAAQANCSLVDAVSEAKIKHAGVEQTLRTRRGLPRQRAKDPELAAPRCGLQHEVQRGQKTTCQSVSLPPLCFLAGIIQTHRACRPPAGGGELKGPYFMRSPRHVSEKLSSFPEARPRIPGCDGRVVRGLCQDVTRGGSAVTSLMGVRLTRRTFDEDGLGPMGNGTELLGYKTKGKTRLST